MILLSQRHCSVPLRMFVLLLQVFDFVVVVFFFQAEDGIRYLVRSRGLGDVYKRQPEDLARRHLPRDLPGVFSKFKETVLASMLQAELSLSLIHI